MQVLRLLNPLQWNFKPRTVITLLTWAIIPVGVAGIVVGRSLQEAASQAGLTPEQSAQLVRNVLASALWATLPLLLLATGAALYFAHVVVQPLLRLGQAMERLSRGDLSQSALPVSSADEVGQITRVFNLMTDRLREMVQTMSTTAAALDTAAGRLESSACESRQATEESGRQIEAVRLTAEQQANQAAAGAQAIRELEEAARQVAAGAQAQAGEVERAATTIREMATAIEQVAAGAGVVAAAAGRTRQAAEDGRQAVQLSAEGMDQVRSRVLEAAEKLRHLSESLQHVDEILQLITDIAGQTDLLALNAAIEAARVGGHGKGFAVVAGEVRRLAERSRTGAREIAGRVEALRQGAFAVVETMEAGRREVEHGVVLSRQAGEALERILAAVAETQGQVESISAASQEIAAASTQVVNATVQLSAIAEENAAASEQMLSSARSVTELIAQVEEAVRKNQGATGAMATSAVQVRSAVEAMVQLTDQVTRMSNTLYQQVERFRL